MPHWFIQTEVATDRSRAPLIACEVYEGDDVSCFILMQSRSPRGEAEVALRMAREFVEKLFETEVPREPDVWEEELRRLDRLLHLTPDAGQVVGIAATLDGGGIVGASLGDCAAWLLGDASWQLTRMQHRLTVLGTGEARPIGFGPSAVDDVVLAGTSSLFEQLPAMEAAQIIAEASDEAPREIVKRMRAMGLGRLNAEVGFLILRRKH